ncbi:MAG TPA: DUF4407 domain-containing protein [Dermatophilaceae bacterium]|nr:DUF4407 domain-containing protein [Dermatophilaceae bacterium]
MSTTQTGRRPPSAIANAGRADDPPRHSTRRPRSAAGQLGFALRRVSGADEPLVSMFTAEKHRFTALGGVIVGTASVAAMSMWFAVVNGLHESGGVALIVATFWFLFIVNLDRWMTATSTSKDGFAALKYLARLALALIFAFVIAEPFVLRLFQSGIETQYVADRSHARSLYTKCNPQDAGAPPEKVDCTGYLLSVSTGGLHQKELVALQTQIEALNTQITADQKTLDGLIATAQAECAGRKIAGTSGRVGEGPRCTADRRTVASAEASMDLAGRRAALKKLQDSYSQLVDDSGSGATTYATDVTGAIDAAMKNLYPNEKPGLLEQFAALDALHRGPNGATIRGASVLLTLLFMAIECLPIIMKLSSGSTEYDQALRSQMESASRVVAARQQEVEARDLLDPTVNRLSYEDQLASATAELVREEKRRHEEQVRDLNNEIAKYRDRLLGGPGPILEGA